MCPYADWVGNVDDRRFTLGYFMFVVGNIVTWRSKKQNIIVHSSIETEYGGMALGGSSYCYRIWVIHQEDLWCYILTTK